MYLSNKDFNPKNVIFIVNIYTLTDYLFSIYSSYLLHIQSLRNALYVIYLSIRHVITCIYGIYAKDDLYGEWFVCEWIMVITHLIIQLAQT